MPGAFKNNYCLPFTYKTGKYFFFSSRRRNTILTCDWSSDVCSSDLLQPRQDETVDRVAHPGHVLDRRQFGTVDRLERPVLRPRGLGGGRGAALGPFRPLLDPGARSEERRVGEGGRAGGSGFA